MWDLWWIKWHWDRYISELWGFPWQCHYAVVLLTYIITWGWTIGKLVAAVQRHGLTSSTWTATISTAMSFHLWCSMFLCCFHFTNNVSVRCNARIICQFLFSPIISSGDMWVMVKAVVRVKLLERRYEIMLSDLPASMRWGAEETSRAECHLHVMNVIVTCVVYVEITDLLNFAIVVKRGEID
jgi:hypothetical protein